MNRLHILLAIVAVLAFVVYPMSLAVSDTTPAQFEESADDIESYSGPDTPWYAVGTMPLLLITVFVVLPAAMIFTAFNQFMRQHKSEVRAAARIIAFGFFVLVLSLGTVGLMLKIYYALPVP